VRRRGFLQAAAALAAGGAIPSLAWAQAWSPTREIRILNGFAAGGSGELLCRIIAESLRPLVGQPVIVDTQAGANGFIAAGVVARAAPDGHTIGMATMGMLTISPQIPGSKVPINVEADLTPIVNAGGIHKVLITHPEAPFRTVPELIAYAKANPGKLAYASAGIGSSPHLAGELFIRQAGIEVVHVPYKGGAPAMIDVAAGRVQMMIGNLPDFLGQVRGGKLRALAAGGDMAPPAMPDLPLIKQWLPQYSVTNWFSFVGPGKLPPSMAATLNAAINRAIAAPEAQKRLADAGIAPLGGSVEGFNAEIARYRANWAGVIKAAGIRAE
jgi:tripartite-type tricarboxylate transporter receptor subunit TctC